MRFQLGIITKYADGPITRLSPWWRNAAILILMMGFTVLIWIAARSYQDAPPIPENIIGPAGETIFTRADIVAGQQVFLKYGLMENGTVWGHGDYLGPDFSAAYLHALSVESGDAVALKRFNLAPGNLSAAERDAVNAEIGQLLKENRYNPQTETVFGFLINLPIVSYFEVGTMLTPNHGHAAMMGVFGMLAVALTVFALRQVSTDEQWVLPEKFIRVSFWGLNIGLALMVVTSLFPGGVLQFIDVLNNGYWHARGPEFLQGRIPRMIEWQRMPGDLVFIGLGVFPLLVASILTWRTTKRI